MLNSELMTRDVITIGPEASLKEAARRMLEAGVSGLPVTDDEGQLIGIITEADFVKHEADRDRTTRAGLLRWWIHDDEGVRSEPRTVGDMMTSPVVTVAPDEQHSQTARVLMKSKIKRAPVLHEGRLVGLISRSDLLRSFVRSDRAILDEIKDDVMKRILWIEPESIEVNCVEGNVTFDGMLGTRSDAELLVTLTQRLDGVASVRSHLTWELDNTRVERASPVSVPMFTKGR